MIRFIYNLLWPIGLLFFLPGYFIKMVRRGGYREKFGQRLGIYDRELHNRIRPRQPKRPILDGSHVHAARLLANNATRVFCHSSSPDRSG